MKNSVKNQTLLMSSKVEECLEEFIIWAEHTNNKEWLAFVKIKLTRLARGQVAFSESLLIKEVSKIKRMIRAIKS